MDEIQHKEMSFIWIGGRAALFEQVYRILEPDGLVSVYPMHVDSDEVSRQMQEDSFSLAAGEYEGEYLGLQEGELRTLLTAPAKGMQP